VPPTIHKRFLSAASAAVLILLAAGPVQAAPAPKIKAAYTVDGDRDGHVDGVSLLWSKKVRGGFDATAPFAFAIPDHRVTQVSPARGRSQRLRVAENPACDTGGSIQVAFSQPRSGAARSRAARGGALARSHRVDMRRFDSPVPRISCAVTLDSDGDAQVDGVRVTYSRAVRSRAQRSGRFLFTVAGYRVSSVAAARGRFLVVRLAERGAPDSGATPLIGYSRPTSRRERPYAVRAGRRGDAFSGTFQGTRDGVAPRLVAGATGDRDRDGLLDAMTLRFSEPVRTAGAAGIAVLGMRVTSSVTRGQDVTLSLAEGTARGDARPGAWTTGAGVTDLAGHSALRSAVAPADGAAPVVTGAVTRDTGGTAGRIDAVTIAFSEPVAHARDQGGAYPFLVADRSVTSVEAASGRNVQVRIAEGAAPDSGARPSVRYIPGPGRPVTDAAGNPASVGLANSADGVAPVLLSAATGDADSDGRTDGVELTFSESVSHGAEAAGSSFGVDGRTVTAAGAASDSKILATLAEAATSDSGTRPAVTYTRDGVEDVRDAAGNATPTSSIAQAADGARPVLLSVATADADDDGRIDRLDTAWSEPLANADDSTAPFSVSASGFSVARVRAADGAALAVDIAEPGTHDTGSTPELAYSGGSEPVRDAAGLEPATRSWPGVTRDALAPRLVSATTGDLDGDGSIDAISARYSEAVVHARETTPSSFTAGPSTVLTAEDAAGDTVLLTLQESGTGDSGLRPALGYTPDGQDDVRDAAGNFAPARTIAQSDDGARPVLLSAATADVDADGSLDRVATSWSEPLDHPDDAAGPFPLSVEQLSVTRVRGAAGQALDIDLAEPTAPDTGSAPDVVYSGGADPIRDANGLEPVAKAYAGVTRDALAPRRVSTATADADFDGKLDGVEIEWSEQVTGSTAVGPYTIPGRTLGGSVAFSSATTRIPFTEDPAQHDTDDTPLVTYDAGPGDLHDVAEGTGDTAEDAPTVGPEAALDRAAPILVAAKTADLTTPAAGNTPNGTIDAVLATFSEPISHSVDGIAPFSLNVAGRTEVDVEGDTGASDRTLYVRVSETASPDGGEKPNVSVVAAGTPADRVKDRAAAPNEARSMTFTGTADEVRPVLMSAQLGERGNDGTCTKAPVDGIDGEVDCVLATWSEDVGHAADAAAPYSISSSGWTIDAGGIGQLPAAKTLSIPLTPAAVKDRDRSLTTVAYAEGVDTPVVDLASPANESLSGTRTADPACRDTGLEGNDAQDPAIGNPLLTTTAPSFQRKCAFDDDWYRVKTDATAHLELLTRPAAGVDVEVGLFEADGDPIAPTDVLETGAAGEIDQVEYDAGLVADTFYWVRVTADDTPSPQEGPYCVVFSDNDAADPGCGPLVGQLVFTEVGFGNDKFVEIKNDFDVPVEMDGANAKLIFDDVLGPRRRECTLQLPTGGPAQSVIDPGEHVLIEVARSATAFGCTYDPDGPGPLPPFDQISTLEPDGERLELSASGSIDVVDFDGLVDSPVAAEHSLEFVESDVVEDADANNELDLNWCRTYAAHTRGAAGDGCDEYRINEVLWRPTSSAATSDGKSFVEIAGNIPALANSELLGGWVLRGVNGLTGDGSADLVLAADASPRSNGTYVVADGVNGATQVSDSDRVWDGLNLNSPLWPDGTGTPGPRGLQLLLPDPPGAPPCVSSADAFGWTTTAQGFSVLFDDLRSCPGLEGQEYTTSTAGSSAARDNLSNGGDTTYSVTRDTGNNRVDFCPQVVPNPGQLNIRPGC
jgi:hypothetical protein